MFTRIAAANEVSQQQKNLSPLGIAATFTAEPLQEVLSFWLQELNLSMQLRFAPYNQVFQQLLEPTSLLATNAGGVNALLLRMEDLAGSSATNSGTAKDNALERNAADLRTALMAAGARSAVPWLVFVCPPSKAALSVPTLADRLASEEERLSADLRSSPSVYLVRPSELLKLYPGLDYDDPRANRLGNMPYTSAGYAALATLLARNLHALTQPPRKVIALDCDQTLWGGICGEDGPEGVQLDAPRLALQQFLREQQQAGMLLCLCSKNNEADVDEVFRQRAEMPLRPEHLAARRVNWHPKSENLRSLAQELNLGLDSFIFIDDSPLECAEVRAGCPEALVLELPASLNEWPQFLRHVWAFDRLKVTAEDRQRTALYQQNRLRAQLQAATPSLSDFLAGLELRIQIEPAREEHLARVSQLTQRTNQFNCTTIRRSAEEVLRLRGTPGYHILAVTVSDRFGDYGLVGVIICQTVGRVLKVDTFLLSCRALGKGVEHQMLARLGQIAGETGATVIEVPFRPTEKNQPAFDFLNRVGAGFRQSVGCQFAFRFPASVAVETCFVPEGTPALLSAEEQALKALSTAPRSQPASSSSQVRYAWIAQNAGSPERLLDLAQRRQPEPLLPAASLRLPPRTETQRQLCALWQRVLRLKQVGINDDFFELGGTSQLAVRLFVELEKLTGQKLPLASLFKCPTIDELAGELERRAAPLRRAENSAGPSGASTV